MLMALIHRCSTRRTSSSLTARHDFIRSVWREPTDQPDELYDLHLNNGRLLEHFHAGNMTYRSPGIAEKVPQTFVEVAPTLAAERDLKSGDMVCLTSARGSITVPVLVSDEVTGNELYLPMHSKSTTGESANIERS